MKKRKEVEDIAESLDKLATTSEEMLEVFSKVAKDTEITSQLVKSANEKLVEIQRKLRSLVAYLDF